MWRSEVNNQYLSQLVFTVFYDYDYRHVFSLNLEFVDLAKLAGQPAPGIFLTIWLLLELQVHAAAPILFTWLMGIELKSLCLQGKHIITEISPSLPFFF